MLPREADMVIHKDMTKIVGSRMYYFAEKRTDAGLHGFWVSKSWSESHPSK